MQKTLFVVNPVSGSKRVNTQQIRNIIISALPAGYNYEIKVWETLGQSQEIHDMIFSGGYNLIAAVGGDGTINFIAQAAMTANVPMAIIPRGSGNGLARHLGIPLKMEAALKMLISGKLISIDTGLINGNVFLCTAGAGFDALIGDMFSKSTTRGLYTYAKMTLQQLVKYKPKEYSIAFDGQSITTRAFILAFANVNQYGNNTFIAPQADLQDGFLDICILKPFNALQSVGIALRIFNKTLTRSSSYQYCKARKIILHLTDDEPVQFDGEPMKMGKKIEIEVVPASLKIMVPQ